MSEINDLPSNENVENSVADSDMAFRIHLVLHRLEEPYKEVFQLRVFGELSFSQIAAIFWKNRIMGESYLSSCKAKNSRKDG